MRTAEDIWNCSIPLRFSELEVNPDPETSFPRWEYCRGRTRLYVEQTLEEVQDLLDAAADPNAVGPEGQTPFQWSAQSSLP